LHEIEWQDPAEPMFYSLYQVRPTFSA
jgi:hypothetical protein